MFKKLRKMAKTKPASAFIYWTARLYCATLRLKIENENEWFDYLQQGGRVLLCGWHQHFFVGVRYFKKYRKYQPALMSSKSLDGQIAGGIAGLAGFHTVWGSSSNSASAALKEMIHRLRNHRLAAHILDGPRGPAGVVKLGAIAIAKNAGAVIVPSVAVADRAWYLHSWDRFMIPKPFSRVTVKFFPKIELPSVMDRDEFENQRKKLEDVLQPYLRL
ncbi:MAG TPA: lysophospholipid acyltransferase family protein [Smithella sp.]|nr:lysophospholipid acyltransferase family protein [Smithella sp.]